MGVMNIIALIISTKLVEKFGRKSLLLFSFVIIFLIMLAYSIIGYAGASGSWAQKILIILWPLGFNIGIGSLTFPYMSEILPDRALGMAVFVNWMASFLTI